MRMLADLGVAPRLVLCSLLLGLWLAPPASAAPIFGRLDVGPITQRAEGGQTPADTSDDWLAVGTAAAGVNTTNMTETPLVSLTGRAYTVAIDNIDQNGVAVGPGIDWRDRGDSTSTQPLTWLGEDFVKNNGGVIRVTLGGLPAGDYTVTSYHDDPDNTQSNNIGVFVTDATGSAQQRNDFGDASANIPGANTAEQVNNLTTDIMNASAATFNIRSNGTDPVLIVFDGRLSTQVPIDIETPFNGMSIEVVPEPGTLGLLGLGALGLLARRRRVA
jgi:PEP-CTERM motif